MATLFEWPMVLDTVLSFFLGLLLAFIPSTLRPYWEDVLHNNAGPGSDKALQII